MKRKLQIKLTVNYLMLIKSLIMKSKQLNKNAIRFIVDHSKVHSCDFMFRFGEIEIPHVVVKVNLGRLFLNNRLRRRCLLADN